MFLNPGVGATDRDAEIIRLGAMTRGVEIFTPRLSWRQRGSYLGAIAYGAELDATSHGAEVSR